MNVDEDQAITTEFLNRTSSFLDRLRGDWAHFLNKRARPRIFHSRPDEMPPSSGLKHLFTLSRQALSWTEKPQGKLPFPFPIRSLITDQRPGINQKLCLFCQKCVSGPFFIATLDRRLAARLYICPCFVEKLNCNLCHSTARRCPDHRRPHRRRRQNPLDHRTNRRGKR